MTNGQIHIGSMSHETAIGILKLMLEAMETYDSISPTPGRVNAVKMGIEALEQESNCSEIPTGSTTKDYLGVDYLGVDAISRQAINGYIDYILSHGMGKKKSFDFIKKFVANLSPVTPQEPKIGHKVSGDLLGGLYCSECMTYVNEYFNYCPHCGAKMVDLPESEG